MRAAWKAVLVLVLGSTVAVAVQLTPGPRDRPDERYWIDIHQDAERVLFKLVAPWGAYLTGFPEAEKRIAEIEEWLEAANSAEKTQEL